jgi:hypothetical protein
MMARAGGLLVLDRPRRDVRLRSGVSRRLVLAAALAGVGVLAGFIASPGHSSSSRQPSSGRQGLSSLPLAAQSAVSRGLGADQSSFFARRTPSGAVSLDNAAQGLRATFSTGGIALSGAHGLRLGLSALAVGRIGALVPVSGLRAASVDRNRVVYASDGVSEWFANGPLGLEQGFTLVHRPAGNGPLTISQTLSGNTLPRLSSGGHDVTFKSPAGALTYKQLVVTDASGARVRARLALAGNRLTITIQDQHAAYPLRVDPIIQQTAELTASNGAAGDELGTSVAISGSTIVAGAPFRTVGSNVDQGVVYVFTEAASGGWTDATQTAELTASDGAATDEFGSAVAISGSTIVVGTPFRNNYRGAAYVYTEPAGGWSGTTTNPMTQTAELSASNGGANDDFGYSVGVSGSTVVVGAEQQEVGSNTYQGAVYAYTAPAGGWVGTTTNPMTQTAELTASDGAASDYLGTAVAVSGSTIVAASETHNGTGSAYVYTEPTGGWSGSTTNPLHQTAELAPSDGAFNDLFGSAIAVAGGTIAVGAEDHNSEQGAVYVYSKPLAGWSGTTANPMPQTAELSASDGAGGGFIFGNGDSLGTSVAVSLSGSTIIAGAPDHTVSNTSQGAAYMFTEPAGGWADETEAAELTASDGAGYDYLGDAVGISGSVIVASSPVHTVGSNASQGAAYTFQDPVTASTVTLTLGPWTLNGNGSWTATATFTVEDASGNPVKGDHVTIASSGSQVIGPVTVGSTPGTYQATITSPTNPGTATVTATDTSATPNAAATAQLRATPAAAGTTTPVGTTPQATTVPSNIFTIGSARAQPDGTIVVVVTVPGPGTVNLLATHEDITKASAASARLKPGQEREGLGRVAITTTAAGKVTVTMHPNAAGRRLVRRHRGFGWALNVAVWTSYTPNGGAPRNVKRIVHVFSAKHR